jgi:hypothetical protein
MKRYSLKAEYGRKKISSGFWAWSKLKERRRLALGGSSKPGQRCIQDEVEGLILPGRDTVEEVDEGIVMDFGVVVDMGMVVGMDPGRRDEHGSTNANIDRIHYRVLSRIWDPR